MAPVLPPEAGPKLSAEAVGAREADMPTSYDKLQDTFSHQIGNRQLSLEKVVANLAKRVSKLEKIIVLASTAQGGRESKP
jgi:hypothetical protein